MIFLIRYNPVIGCVIVRGFEDEQRQQATAARLDLEIELAESGHNEEVVILEAEDEAALRRTHRRYFASIAGLATTKVQ